MADEQKLTADIGMDRRVDKIVEFKIAIGFASYDYRAIVKFVLENDDLLNNIKGW